MIRGQLAVTAMALLFSALFMTFGLVDSASARTRWLKRVDARAGLSFEYPNSLALTELAPVGAFDSLVGAGTRYVIHKKGRRFVAGDDPAQSILIITSNPGRTLSSLQKNFKKEKRQGTVADYQLAQIGGKPAIRFVSMPTAVEKRRGKASWMYAWAVPYTPRRRISPGSAPCAMASLAVFFRGETKSVREAMAKLSADQRRILKSFRIQRPTGKKARDACSK